MKLCDYVVRNHADTVRRMWERTGETGREHGVVFHDDGATTVSRGRESDISGYQTGAPAGSVVKITAHTHPSNNVAPSLEDLTSIASAWQFPPARKRWSRPSEPIRGFLIISSRLGEEDIAIHGWEANRKAMELSTDQQSEVSRTAHQIARRGPRHQQKAELKQYLSQYVDECYATVSRR